MNKSHTLLRRSMLIFFLLFASTFALQAQYFGQNKVRYNNEKFKVLQTPHFEIYYYLQNEKLIAKFAEDAET